MRICFLILSFVIGTIQPNAQGTIEDFGQRFAERLNSATFKVAHFCNDFWLSGQMATCERSIPWSNLRSHGPQYEKIVMTAAPDAAFVVLNLTPAGTVLLTATQENKSWRMSLDNKPVWQRFSDDWQTGSIFKEFRYAKNLAVEEQELIESKIASYHVEIRNALSISSAIDVPFYFLNSPKLANVLSLNWPKFISGGARDGFAIIVGDPLVGNWSVLFHELVHSYTTFPGEFWKGQGFYPNAMFSEGLAMWFQMQKIWDDKLPASSIAGYICKDIQTAEKILTGDLLSILEDNVFRKLDEGGYHPAYFAGAAVLDPFLTSQNHDEFKVLWNEIGLANNLEERKKLLLKRFPESDLKSHFVAYMKAIRKQMIDRASFVCP